MSLFPKNESEKTWFLIIILFCVLSILSFSNGLHSKAVFFGVYTIFPAFMLFRTKSKLKVEEVDEYRAVIEKTQAMGKNF